MRRCYHLDLYRLADPDEIEYLGLRDMLQEEAVILVEWPEQGRGALPPPDLMVRIRYRQGGRELTFEAETGAGTETLEKLRGVLELKVKS
jgi:tRNA threonylcarbamoyladenosine biosynthesis protein TsaE